MRYDEVVVGDVVHWFPSGESGIPCAGIVLVVNPNGMVCLNVTNQSGQTQYRGNVWPIGSKALADNPEVARKNGAWDWTRPEKAVPWGGTHESAPEQKTRVQEKKQSAIAS